MSLNVGARVDFAKASRALFTSFALNPACDKILETSNNSVEEVPNAVLSLPISAVRDFKPAIDFPVT